MPDSWRSASCRRRCSALCRARGIGCGWRLCGRRPCVSSSSSRPSRGSGRRADPAALSRAIGMENKSKDGGFDPVTVADREAEAAIRREIRRVYPDHGILGEEHGFDAGASPVHVDHRSDRRHALVRARAAALGHADRAERRRGADRRPHAPAVHRRDVHRNCGRVRSCAAGRRRRVCSARGVATGGRDCVRDGSDDVRRRRASAGVRAARAARARRCASAGTATRRASSPPAGRIWSWKPGSSRGTCRR